jgi:hypothetical protein
VASGSNVFTQLTTYTVTVTPQAPGAGTPTGTVTFSASNSSFVGTPPVPLGAVALDANGVATLTTNQTPILPTSYGSRQTLITAQYSGDANFAASPVSGYLIRTPVRQSTVGAFDPGSGIWFLRNSNSGGAADFRFAYGLPGWRPVVGDWDGNGTTTVGVVDPSTNTFFLRNENSSGAADAGQFQFGLPGWLPVAGNWRYPSTSSSVGVYDPVTSTFYLRASTTDPTVISQFQFGIGGRGWIPVAGDWGGTGRDSVGLYDPATSTWYLRPNTYANDMTPPLIFPYGGGPGWQPVVGTWNPNPRAVLGGTSGPTTVGVVDPTGTWYLRFSNASGAPDVPPFSFGLPNWTPLGGTWGLPPGQAVPADPLAPALPLRATGAEPLGAAADLSDVAAALLAARGRHTGALDEAFAAAV